MTPFNRLQRYRTPLAALLGLVATLGFPPFGLWPLSIAAFAGLFALTAGSGVRRSLWLGWVFGFAHFLSGIYWIFISTSIYGGAPAWLGVLLTVVLSGAYMAPWPALALGLATWLRVWTRPAGWLALPALWLLTELGRGHLLFDGFPWLSLGYVTVGTPLQKLAPLAGVHGISAVLVLLAYALWQAVGGRGTQRRVALAAFALTAAAIAVLPDPVRWTQALGAPLDVAIVQGDIPQEEKWLPEMQLPTLRAYRDMTLAVRGADLVIWPEAALTQTYDEVKEDYLDPLAAQLAQDGTTLLAGMLIEEKAGLNYYNSVVAIGASQGRYDKRHLVPFGEYFPIPRWLRPLLDVLNTPYADLSAARAPLPPIIAKGLRLGVTICFEDVFASDFRAAATDAALMVNVTNDAWFGHSAAAAQHLQMARMRALETGRTVLRASNTGVSAVIGADGTLQAAAGFFTRETLRAPAQPRSGTTPYVRLGNAPLWGLALVAIVVALRGRRGGAHGSLEVP
ncbi:MAG: apolipoprotein N-acyltransferase [Nevskiaceae bacterium]|nr:MAG: apolipoprotein N-acyltransferase [Nevskiaceae bacterium]